MIIFNRILNGRSRNRYRSYCYNLLWNSSRYINASSLSARGYHISRVNNSVISSQSEVGRKYFESHEVTIISIDDYDVKFVVKSRHFKKHSDINNGCKIYELNRHNHPRSGKTWYYGPDNTHVPGFLKVGDGEVVDVVVVMNISSFLNSI
jgi:hypothetical protein